MRASIVRSYSRTWLTLLCLLLIAAPAYAGSLVEQLTSRVGVSGEQAAGGAGALFKLAKQRLSPADFVEVSDAVPDMGTLLQAAPQGGGALGAASSLLGGGNSLGDLAGLAASFETLGMSQDLISEFVPVVLEYVETNGSRHAMELLQGVLS